MSKRGGPESRRTRRRPADGVVAVVDSMTGQPVGRVGNLSETGMLLIGHAPLVEDALYQFQFDLGGEAGPACPLEVGVHVLWQDGASGSRQTWTGMRFINVPGPHRRRLREWLDRPE